MDKLAAATLLLLACMVADDWQCVAAYLVVMGVLAAVTWIGYRR